MNTTDFATVLHAIDRSIELTKFKLEYDKCFPSDTRIEFNQALKGLLELLQRDQLHAQSTRPAWQTAYRIVHLKKVQVKLENIRQKIFEISRPSYFVKKIKMVTVPTLEGRIKELKTAIESKGRLPFSVGTERDEYFEDVKQKLQLQNTQEIFEAEKEYFHLLGNHLDDNKLKEVDVESHNGNLEINSLISWEQVLNLFVQEGNESEKQIGSTLLSMIKEAIPYSLKTSFAFYLEQIQDQSKAEAQETAYFEDYLESHQRKRCPSLTKAQFLNKYQLGAISSVPERAIINEIAWDMTNSISSFKQGDTRLFSLGTCSHRIAVQVTCTQESPKLYEYKIFNTGLGVNNYHELDQKEEFARPLIFKEVSPSAFSYSFFSNLLRLSLEKTSIEEFYQLHNQVLVNEEGGKKDLSSGAFYPIQKYDTCSYSAIEAWIYSYLSEQQIKHFDLIKAKVSTNKQEAVVKILSKNLPKSANWTMKGKRKIRPNDPYLQGPRKRQKLKESETLLELGHEYLQQAVQNFSGLQSPVTASRRGEI